ncbi:RHS repeat domain-containing protein [Haloferula sp.]|uniref:RHS repeat domain-containing protein n=1 Tax=Haloferula sp. TaxID=2497595 RepID=UPI00329BB7E6
MQLANGTNRDGSEYPWDPNTPSDENYAVANQGQLKAVFALHFTMDLDKNGFPDLREEALSDMDSDQDGISDGQDAYPFDSFNGEDPVLLLSGPWKVKVTNQEGVPIPGTAVEFQVVSGIYLFGNGSDNQVLTTGSGGETEALSGANPDSDLIRASLANQTVMMPRRAASLPGIPLDGAGGIAGTIAADEDPAPHIPYSVGNPPPSGDSGDSEEPFFFGRIHDYLQTSYWRRSQELWSGQGGWIASEEEGRYYVVRTTAEEVKDNEGNPVVAEGEIVTAIEGFTQFGDDPGNLSDPHPFDPSTDAYPGPPGGNYRMRFATEGTGYQLDYVDASWWLDHVPDGTTLSLPYKKVVVQRDYHGNLEELSIEGSGQLSLSTVPSPFDTQPRWDERPLPGWDSTESIDYMVEPMLSRLYLDELLKDHPIRIDEEGERVFVFGFPFGALAAKGEEAIEWEIEEISDGDNELIYELAYGGSAGLEASSEIAEGRSSGSVELATPVKPEGSGSDSYVILTIYPTISMIPDENGVEKPTYDKLSSEVKQLKFKVSIPSLNYVFEDTFSLQRQDGLGGEADSERSPSSSEDVEAFPGAGSAFAASSEPTERGASSKIGMDGRPTAGGQALVDSKTRDFHYGAVDVALEIPASDLSISVRRSSSPAIWNEASGLRPHERPDLPFGPGWTSNLASFVKLDEALDFSNSDTGPGRLFGAGTLDIGGSSTSSEFLTPSTATVSDYQGSRHQFQVSRDATSGGHKFSLVSPARHDRATIGMTLEADGDGNLTLSQPMLGITHRYESAIVIGPIANNRIRGSHRKTSSRFYRLTEVEDRFGNQLSYSYEVETNLIPKTICVADRPELQIAIQQDTSGRVTRVWDPDGVETVYSYDEPAVTHTSLRFDGKLDSVNRGGLVGESYGYEFHIEADRRPIELRLPNASGAEGLQAIDSYHWQLDSITDGAGNETRIIFESDITRNFRHNSVDESGDPLPVEYFAANGQVRDVERIVHPGDREVVITGDHRLASDSSGTEFDAHSRLTQVTDLWGHEWTFEWIGPNRARFELSNEFKASVHGGPLAFDETPSWLESYPGPEIVYYDELRVYNSKGSGEETIEVFEFDPTAGFQVSFHKDRSGRETKIFFEDALEDSPHASASGINRFRSPPVSKIESDGISIEKEINSYFPDRTLLRDASLREFNFEYTPSELRLPSFIGDESTTDTRFVYDGGEKLQFLRRQQGAEVLREVEFKFEDSNFPNFVTSKGVNKIGTSDPDWVGDLLTTYVPDPQGRAQTVSVGGIEQIGISRDLTGRVLEVSNALGQLRSFEYDDAGRLVTRTNEDGSSATMSYDARGLPVLVENEEGIRTGQVFDELGRSVKAIQDMNRNLSFNPATGELLGVEPGIDIVVETAHDESQGKVTWTDPEGYKSVMFEDHLGRPKKLVTPKSGRIPGYEPVAADDHVREFFYDDTKSASTPSRIVGELGYEVLSEFDSLGRTTSVLREYGTDESGTRLFRQEKKIYDAFGRLEETRVARTPMDENGDPVGDAGVEELIHHVEFDELHRPSRRLFAYGTDEESITELKFTSTGLLHQRRSLRFRGTTEEDHEWEEYDYEFDQLARLVKTIAPEVLDSSVVPAALARPEQSRSYNDLGQVMTTTDPTGRITRFGYDSRGRLSWLKNPEAFDADAGHMRSAITRYEYDNLGNLVTLTDPRGHEWFTEFDDANRPTRQISPVVEVLRDPAGAATQEALIHETGYDLRGLRSSSTDANGFKAFWSHDARGQISEFLQNPVQDPDPANPHAEDVVVGMEFDPLGRLLELVDGEGQVTHFDYDGLGRRLALHWDADDQTRKKTNRSEYDALQLIRTTDADNRVTEFDYDQAFRLDLVRCIGQTQDNLDYEYFDSGRLREVTEPNGSLVTGVSYTYDNLGRIASSKSAGVTYQFGYDLSGRIYQKSSSETTRIESFQYDEAGRVKLWLDEDTSSSLSQQSLYEYDVAGNPLTVIRPGGVAQRSDFDASGRITSQRLTSGFNLEVLSGLDYSYDPKGNITLQKERSEQKLIPDRNVSMWYDRLHRLVREEQSDPETLVQAGLRSAIFDYDKAGNRTRRVVEQLLPDTTTSPIFDETLEYGSSTNGRNSNQLYSLTRNSHDPGFRDGEFIYHYDGNGNRNGRSIGSEWIEYDYDHFNRLRGIDVDGAGAVDGVYSFAYDYLSRRVRREVPGGSYEEFSFLGSEPALEFSGPSGGPRSLIEQNQGGGSYSGEVGGSTTSFRNLRQDIVAQVGSSGQLLYQGRYHDSGALAEEQGVKKGRYGANSRVSEVTGALYEWHRYRDPESGSYLSRDPAGFVDGPNVYRYASANPWSGHDPTGLVTVNIGDTTRTNGEQLVPAGVGYSPGVPFSSQDGGGESSIITGSITSSPTSSEEPFGELGRLNYFDAVGINKVSARATFEEMVEAAFEFRNFEHKEAIYGGGQSSFTASNYWDQAASAARDLGYHKLARTYLDRRLGAIDYERTVEIVDGLITAAIDAALIIIDGPLPVGDYFAAGSMGLRSVKAIGSAPKSKVDDVISETLNGNKKNITSQHTLTADEALTAGEKFVGPGYKEIGKPGSGVFRSADGTKQFRMDNNSLQGNHAPNVPHVHLETYAPGARKPTVNNHIPFTE